MKVDVLLRNGTSIPIDTSGGSGTPGPKGDTGAAGAQGPAGKDGKDGEPGAKGEKGDIGPAGPTYTLPASTINSLGGVKQAAKQTDLAADAEPATITDGVNALMKALRDAGILEK